MFDHHAYLVAGDPRAAGAVAQNAAHKLGLPVQGNPDVAVHIVPMLTIEMARDIERFARARPLGEAKVCVIGCSSATREAQNALLKTLEEPRGGTVFFLVTPEPSRMLETVRSRCMSYALNDVSATALPRAHTTSGETGADAAEFLAGTYAQRAAYIAPILEEKDKAAAVELVRALEHALHAHARAQDTLAAHAESFRALEHTRDYLHDTGASMKILLEYIAVVLPKIPS